MAKFNAEQIQEAIENAGWDVRTYSGRFMFGEECPGVEVESINSICRMVLAVAENDPAMAEELANCMKSDSMGRDMIVYWPRYTYAKAA